ncbi:phage major capsid protein [Microbacterium sp. APC 3901]|uniref:phage major capsid protein n=1 Tax=Microbacterium sp. APC 3901 TaxID=3035192 RepID=UPI0025B568B8|nr:phage major capsid protein [Microbacterium sp. APC 3901]MDN3443749.1 phage major capsid protein [Microbacterium sp. APC 3901]
MDPKKQLAQIKAAMAAVVNGAKAAGRDITEAELASLEQKAEEAARLQKSIDMMDRGTAILNQFKQGDDDGEGSSAKASFLNVKATARSVAQKAIGTSSDLVGVEFIRGIVPIDRPRTSLLQAIPAIRRSSPVYEYLRQTVRTMNAAPVAEGALKPTSIVTMEPVEAKLKVFAHISEPIPKYILEDNDEVQRFIESEFVSGLDLAIQAQLVSGSGMGENLLGWLNASGILTVTGVDLITTARKAIERLTANGRTPSFIAVAPADWTTALTTRNTSGNFDFGPTTPVNEAEMKLWGVDVIESPAVTAGTVWTLAEGANSLSTDGKVDARWSDSMSDDFARNLVRLRVETRVNSDVRTPSGIVKGEIVPTP